MSHCKLITITKPNFRTFLYFQFKFQNAWIDSEVLMKDYVPVLQKTMDNMQKLVGTANPWTEELQKDWLS